MANKSGLIALVGVIALSAVFLGTFEPQADEVDLPPAPEPRRLTKEEMQLYIDVYSAMQSDHDLLIEDALAPHSMSLKEFRELEGRIQRDSTAVERVRRALLEYVQQKSVFARAGNTPTRPESPEKPPPTP